MLVYPKMYGKLKRGPQVILPKDIGIIIAYTGVNKESVCVDAGTGSGWLAIALASVSKKVYSYDLREDFIELAKRNMEILGIGNLVVKKGDVTKRIAEKNVDVVTLDLPNSDKALANAKKSLKADGTVVGYLPNAEQVQKFVSTLNKLKFTDIHTVEVIVRDILVRKEGMRPTNTGLWHTAYLVFARKA
ncbi:MAG: methyltransferase domain-containing protein [Candidatus Micrarchaeota archaeon]|nr:methyltransferase domain-containing protein [Candidatus Micrarchaeota archaeon]MDE1804208.1 methyltransferase domain-containing protein [Candidatus Micrarchaeota archaeon]MDE1846664.1 methyltransferase domain-containing protein [Candidatus Micrarchaeota archaeon]